MAADEYPSRVSVDPNALESLRRFGGDALLRQLIVLFRDQVSVRSAAMRTAVTNGDLTAAAQAAHALKSSAGQIGAVGLQELCRLIESAGRDAEAVALAGYVGELDVVLPVVDAWLTDRGFPREA